MKKRIVISYSGGKDSTLALNRLIRSNEWEIDSLLTTIIEDSRRTSAHGVRESLLEEQALSLGIPLRKVYIPAICSNEVYENIMKKSIDKIVQDGVNYMMFGDIHLQDVKEYREKILINTPINAIFPIWGEDPNDLIHEFLQSGFKTVVTCIDSAKLDASFIGRVVDDSFLNELPNNVDVCGEYGEFHTFVFDGPLFKKPIDFVVSTEITVTKDKYTNEDRYYHKDLISIT
jgi:uncharacterized protein (TIGR00290 family)